MLISQHLKRRRQEDYKFKASLGYTMKSHLKKYTEKQAWVDMKVQGTHGYLTTL